MVMLGLGGVLVEVLDEVVFAPLPLRQDQALAMIRRLKGAALFDGVRGGPKADSAALADVLVRLAAFAADHADLIDEIDLNPIRVHPAGDGVSVLDALIIKRRDP